MLLAHMCKIYVLLEMLTVPSKLWIKCCIPITEVQSPWSQVQLLNINAVNMYSQTFKACDHAHHNSDEG